MAVFAPRYTAMAGNSSRAAERPVYVENAITQRAQSVVATHGEGTLHIPVNPLQVWNNVTDVPDTPPQTYTASGQTVGVVTLWLELTLEVATGVPGTKYWAVGGPPAPPPATGGAVANLLLAIPATFGNHAPTSGSAGLKGTGYTPVLVDAKNVPIPYNIGVWVVDNVNGYIDFPYGLPPKVALPMRVSFYQYAGAYGGLGADVWQYVTDGVAGNSVVLNTANPMYDPVANLVFPLQSIVNLPGNSLAFDTAKGAFRAGNDSAGTWFATHGTNSTMFGSGNSVVGDFATVCGGQNNVASNLGSLVGAGDLNVVDATGAFIGAGSGNIVAVGADYSGIGAGVSCMIITQNHLSFIGGGEGNKVDGGHGFIGGGEGNEVHETHSAIAGGQTNNIAGNSGHSFIGGGEGNKVDGEYGFIGGGEGNEVHENHSAIASGQTNTIAGNSSHSFIGAGLENHIAGGAGESSICGGNNNTVGDNGFQSFIGGGTQNVIGGGMGESRTTSAIVGGTFNRTDSDYSFIGGGNTNTAFGLASAIAGGDSNNAAGDYSAICGGYNNSALGLVSAIAGGDSNNAAGDYSAIGGGYANSALGLASIVPGGRNNQANDTVSFAAGGGATSANVGAFVWSDYSGSGATNSTTDTGANSVTMRGSGGFTFYTSASGSPDTGAILPIGSSVWAMISDRNKKTGIVALDPLDTLQRIRRVPVHEYYYKGDDKKAHKYRGVMAQDWHEQFPGSVDKLSIDTVSPAGVALSGIQGLAQLIDRQSAEISALRERVSALERC